MRPFSPQSLAFLLCALSVPVLSELDVGSGHETTFIVSDEEPFHKVAPKAAAPVPPKSKSVHVKLTHLDVEDVFPDECPTDQLSTDAVILCRARVAWERSVNRLFPKTNGPRKFGHTTKRTKSFDKRVVKKTDGNLEDCLLHRREPRPYPHYCYGRGNFTWEDFANQWQMIRGDLMYTFDFVLYDRKHTNRKENQLWFLISYLKELATNIDNPIDLVEAVKTSNRTAKNMDIARRNKLAKRNLKALNDRVERLEKLVQHTNRWTVYN